MIRTTSPDRHDFRIAAAPRELDSRISNGIHVQLLWHPVDGHVSVAVNDTKTGEPTASRTKPTELPRRSPPAEVRFLSRHESNVDCRGGW
jgi:hypothetical protein